MLAAVVTRRGPPEVLQIRELPEPMTPRHDQVLVRVRATSVNPIDTYLRGGLLPIRMRDPFILGGDACGTVEATGPDAREFSVGQRVFGLKPYTRGDGCYAQRTSFRARDLAPAPDELDDVALACAPLVGLTAWQALFDHAELRPGERVLIHGGSGGVGSFAIQLAKVAGATVYTTASPRNHAFCQQLGADEVLDYHAREHLRLRALDVVFDTIGSYYRDSLSLLRARGRLISTTLLGDDERVSVANLTRHGLRTLSNALRRPFGVGRRVTAVRVKPSGEQLRKIAALLVSGAVRVKISHSFPLEQIASAHRQSQSKRTVGKIAITIP